MQDKPKQSFVQQAARASWILPLATIVLMGVGSAAMKTKIGGLISGAVFLLLLLAGMILGILGCFGVKRHGAKTTIVPGAIGAVLNAAILGLLIAIAVPSFFKARGASLQKRNDALKALAEQTNKQLPVMADSETRVDKVVVLRPDLLEYRYTLVNQDRSEYDAEALASKARPQLLNQYQTSDQFKFFRENRIAVSFSYYDKNGQSITNIIASAKEASNHTSDIRRPADGSPKSSR